MGIRVAIALAIAGTLASAPRARAATVEATDLRGPAGQALCVDVAGSRQANGTDVILYPCHGGTFSGNRVQLWQCNGSAAQKFRYDRGSGAVAMAAAPGYCLDAGQSFPNVQLWSCNATAPQRFSVSTPYGARRFDELTFLTAHNAFNNYEDSRWAVPNQSRGIVHALDDGVRALMLDVHSFESGTARCILSFGSDCYPRDLYLCHGDCGGVPGVGYALPRQSLAGTLQQIVDWLGRHPDELVTVFLEDYSSHDELRGVLDRVAGLRARQFDPYARGVAQWGWPLARELVDTDRRLLLISDNWQKRDLGVAYGPDFTVENYWSIGTWGDQYQCTSRWDSVPLDRTDAGFRRLFVMNHFRDIATAPAAAIDNGYGNLTRRLVDNCVPAARRKPNYVAVDFYETGGDGGPARLVREVGRTAVILFSDAWYGGRVQLLGAGNYRAGDLAIGNDTVSSLAISDGWFAVLWQHDAYAGQSRLFTSSTPWLGNDFNDVASSIQIGLSHFGFDDPGTQFE